MNATISEPIITETALEAMRQAGNPFRNFFARNPDDDICARFHVPELFAKERDQLLGVVNLFRVNPTTHSELIPVLGNKGAGKTHLLHSIKHGRNEAGQMIITPGTYQKDTDFLEYLLFQAIDTLLSGGKQMGRRPLEYISEELGRQLLHRALLAMTQDEQMDIFPAPGLGKWMRKLGLSNSQAVERVQWLTEKLFRAGPTPLKRLAAEVQLDAEKTCELVWKHLDKTEAHNTAGIMRRHIYLGLVRAALLGDESELANFLTYGFAELDYKVKPTRHDLVLALFRVLMEAFQTLKIPVVIAFDQLEDLLLVRRNDDGHRVAEAFFAGLVQVMHQIDGICFLIFAERGLWNRFVPSLDGYIQDRLNNPVHVPGHGTIKALRLEAPSPNLVRRVVEVRMSAALSQPFSPLPLGEAQPFSPLPRGEAQPFSPLPRGEAQPFSPLPRGEAQPFSPLPLGEAQPFSPLPRGEAQPFSPLPLGEGSGVREARHPAVYPFNDDQVQQIALTEPTLRDMLQQFRQLFDHIVFGEVQQAAFDVETPITHTVTTIKPSDLPPAVKSVVIVETPAEQPASMPRASADAMDLAAMWEHALADAKAKLEPEGSLTGATRELQAGLGAFLQICHEHGVKVGPWRMQHVVPEFTFSDHPTYGAMSIAHWVCKDGQPWKVGIGLFLGRGAGKPRDLEIKLTSLDATPAVIDYMILLRPDDDVSLTGKSKAVWQESERKGRSARLEPMMLEQLAILYAFPRWLTALSESLPPGQALPNLADHIQDQCEKLLEQVCLPIAT